MPAHSEGSDINNWSHSMRSWRHLLFWDTAAMLAGPAALGTVSFTYTPAPVARLLIPDTTAGVRPCSLGRFG